MFLTSRSSVRWVVALSVMLLVGLLPGMASAATADDLYPGVALPPSPVNGSLSDIPGHEDLQDYFYIDLVEGEQIDITFTAAPGSVYVCNLFVADGESAPSISGWDVYAYPQKINYVVPPDGGGRLVLRVMDAVGYGKQVGYTITWKKTGAPVNRMWGVNRYDTSCAIARGTYRTADSVILATGANFADALSASYLAGVVDGPVMLVGANVWDIWSEIVRLGPSHIYIVGGVTAVNAQVENDLIKYAKGWNVERIAGANRYETAAKIARRAAELAGVEPTKAFVCKGTDFPDALAVSPFAFSMQMPVLLTPTGTLDGYCASVIEDFDITDVYIPGSTVAVSEDIEVALGALNDGATQVTERFSGESRYNTAGIAAEYAVNHGWATWDFMGVATGTGFADALSGSVTCGKRGGVLALTNPKTMNPQIAAMLGNGTPDATRAVVFGSTAAVSSDVFVSVTNAVP